MATNNIEFNYARQDDFQEPGEEPEIRSFETFGELSDITNDPDWMKTRLYSIYSEVEPLLNSLSERSKGVTALDLDEFRSEVAEEKKRAHVKEPYERILNLIKNERERAQEAVSNLEKRILDQSEPVPPKDFGERFSNDSLMAEIRMLIRSQASVQDRIGMVEKALESGDPSFLLACVSAPDEIVPADKLKEIRRGYAFSENLTLKHAETDAKEIQKSIERRTSQISGTATKILMTNGLDMPISKKEFFEFFPAKDELDAARKRRMIDSEADLKRRQKQRQNFDAQSIGVSM